MAGRDGLFGAVDRDGGAAQWPQLTDEVANGQTGPVLGLAGDGQGGEHDGEVRLDRVLRVVEHRPGPQVGLAHPEGLLDVPQVVVGRDDLAGGHDLGGDVGDVALVMPSSG